MGNPNTVLIDFDSIIDYKIGIIILLKNNPEYLRKYYINQYQLDKTERQLQLEHIYSINDIVSKVLADKHRDQYEKIIQQFLNSPYESDIYYLSSITNIYRLINLSDKVSPVQYTIRCRNIIQKNCLENILPNTVGHIIIAPRKDININAYGRVILGYIKHVSEFNDPKFINFLVANFRENFEKDANGYLLERYVKPIGLENTFTLFHAYNTEDNIYFL